MLTKNTNMMMPMQDAVLLHSSVSLHDKTILFIAPHPDDDVIGCGALLFYLAKMATTYKPRSIHVAYGVSGFRGVTDAYLDRIGGSVGCKKAQKTLLRQKEACACCDALSVGRTFWKLPFYEAGAQCFADGDCVVVATSLQHIAPDVIVLIDEANDPHGTHRIVRDLVLDVVSCVVPNALLLGYRVWEEGYGADESNLILFFDQVLMEEKKKLVECHVSQLEDPAHPCTYASFIELMVSTNENAAQRHKANHSGCFNLQYAECYKILT